MFGATGTDIPLDRWEDSMVAHYIANLDLTKSPDKNEEDAGDSGAAGFMGLGTAISLYTDLPAYKFCRGISCKGPCPLHDAFGYNGVDAWAGLQVFLGALKDMESRGISYDVYRQRFLLGAITQEMEERGVATNRPYIAELNETLKAEKLKLYPPDAGNKKEEGGQIVDDDTPPQTVVDYSPTSPKQIQTWFGEACGIVLQKTDKKTIEKEYERQCKRWEVDPKVLDEMYANESTEDYLAALPDYPLAVAELHRLKSYKGEGKGTDSWFSDKYYGRDGLIHPRFPVTAASTGRLASSRPNCFDNETEILTNTGFKLFKDLLDTDLVAQWHPWGEIEFVKPTKYFCYAYTGAFVHLRNEHIDLAVTVDHRCPLINRKSKELRVVPAISYGEDKLQKNAGLLVDVDDPLPLRDEEIRFLIAVQADGSIAPTCIDFSFTKKRKIERLLTLLRTLGYSYRVQAGANSRTRIYVYDGRALCQEWLGATKSFSPRMYCMSAWQRAVFCSEVMFWDGCHTANNHYASKDKRNADFVASMFILSGNRTNVRKYVNVQGSVSWQVDVSQNDYSMTTNIQKTVESVTNKPVYCVEVPSSFVLVRRNGKTVVSGNCQNLPARGWGLAVRKAVVPRSPALCLAGADFSQLELRMCLYESGVDPYSCGADAFSWLVEQAPEFAQAGELTKQKPRNVAKMVSHGSDYLMGLMIYTDEDLEKPKIVKEIKAGALIVYKRDLGGPFDWRYGGGWVAFAGAHLASELFRDKSLKSRKLALDIQEGIYFKRFASIREWQKRVLDEIEATGAIRSRTGMQLRLYGTPEKNAKQGVAFLGQGNGAWFATQGMLRYKRDYSWVPLLNVHDELVGEFPVEMSDKEIYDHFQIMTEEVPGLPGFRCPVKVKRGPNWGEMKEISG